MFQEILAMDGKVILVDNSSYERHKIKLILERTGSFDVIEVSSLSQFMLINLNSISDLQLIILDVSYPNELDGYKALQQLKEKGLLPRIPVIVTTRMDIPEIKSTVMKFQIKDYIIKPYKVKRLEDSIRGILTNREEEFKYDASGIGTIKMSFDDYIRRELNFAKRTGSNLSFVVFTMLNINEEEVKASVISPADRETIFTTAADVAESILRLTDTIIVNKDRDIIITLPSTSRNGAGLVCEKMRVRITEALQKLNPEFINHIYLVHVSFPEDGEDFQSLIRYAYKKVSDKEMLEKLVSIKTSELNYANKKYSRFTRLF
jgi:PleD family two-component response regulator